MCRRGRARARRRSPDLAETLDRRSPEVQETYGQQVWLGRETGHSSAP